MPLAPSFFPALRHSLQRLLCLLLPWWLVACASLPDPASRQASQAIPASHDTGLGLLAEQASPDATLSGFRLMPGADYALSTRLELIRRAERSLDVQYYQIKNDETGRLILRALRDAALRGVRVRLLIDDLYTEDEDALLQGLAATPGLELRLFNPFMGLRGSLAQRLAGSAFDLRRVTRRMHNKLFIADGAMAVAGGRNLANEYFMRSSDGNFIDLDTFVTGALLPSLSRIFDTYWNSDYAFPLASVLGDPGTSPEDLRRAFDLATGLDTTPTPPAPPPNDLLGYAPLVDELRRGRLGLIWAPAQAYGDAPTRVDGQATRYGEVPLINVESVRYNVIDRIHRAQKSVTAISPYLIPGPDGLEWIHLLRERGVHFSLLTNSLAATDEPLVYAAYRRYRAPMLKEGVRIYELGATRVRTTLRLGHFGQALGRLHEKAAVVDGRWLFLGSMNMDPRSAELNTELGLIIDSPELSAQVQKLVDNIQQHGAYELRLTPDRQQVQWWSPDLDQPLDTDPDTDWWLRLRLNLLAPWVPDSIL